MLEKLSIKGFKCFDDVTIIPKNITLLVGKNSAGKTSVIHSLLALKQNGSNPFRGKYINLGEIPELMNVYTGSEVIEIIAHYNEDIASISIEGFNASKREIKLLESEIVYCSAARVGVQDTYEKNPEDNDSVATDCRYAFSYYCKHQDDVIDPELIYDDETVFTFAGQIDYWLDKIVGCRMSSKYIENTNLVQVQYSNKTTLNVQNCWCRPQNVGTGVTYIAMIIIAAFSCKKGDILIVENPEIHLHPSAQSKFLEFLSFMSLCGIQIIIETHSDHIFNGLRKCVHNSLIDVENQSIYFFKIKDDGCCEPVLINIDKDGRLLNTDDGLFDQIQNDLDVILGW